VTPTEQAVIDAARAWRKATIPNTSSAPLREHAVLVLAVDQLDCPHPVSQHVYSARDDVVRCGRCGVDLHSGQPIVDVKGSS